MRTFLCLLVVAAAALSYWHVPVQELLHIPQLTVSPARPQSVPEAPAPAVVASVQPVAAVPATTAPAPTSARPKADLASQIAQAQQAAVAKYPALAVAGSEINSRFVFRYKALLAQQSPRLLNPTWPMQLADECAAASTAKTKAVATR